MTDKVTLLREGNEAFDELRRTIAGLSEAEMREVWLGTWGVRRSSSTSRAGTTR